MARPALESVRVTVVVPSFNHAPYLRDCIDSVLAQDHPCVELVVVDDGSTDGSMDILASYGSRLRLIRQQGGRQARARNLALREAQGDLVCFLDSDDRYLQGRIRSAVQALNGRPEVAVAWTDFRTIDGAGHLLSDMRWQPRHADFRKELIAGNPICNATVTVRRSVLDEIGGFDERVPRACDGAAWYQIAARGHQFVHLDGLFVEYRLHGQNDSNRFAAMTRERDIALCSASEAYVRNGVVSTPEELVWLRDALAGQYCFDAAALVQKYLSTGPSSLARCLVYRGMASTMGLAGLAQVRALKHALRRWSHA